MAKKKSAGAKSSGARGEGAKGSTKTAGASSQPLAGGDNKRTGFNSLRVVTNAAEAMDLA